MEPLTEFLLESNEIEGVYGEIAYFDAKNAWHFAIDYLTLNTDSILTIHKILMARLNPRIAGKFRKVGVMVGGRVCPNPGTINRLIQNWLNEMPYVIKGAKSKKENICEQVHVNFEKIHPFEDGNGRVGRILWNLHRRRNGLPLKIIHVGQEQFEYYKLFKE